MATVLLVEDDEDLAVGYRALLRRIGHTAEWAPSLAEALRQLARQPFDLVMADLTLPDGNGLDVLRAVRKASPDSAVVVQTGMDRADAALQAIRLGASDYLVKPVMPDLLPQTLEAALHKARAASVRKVQVQSEERLSPGLARALGAELEAAARARAPALVTGESGTGKERVARLLHELSPRAAGPFISYNAACSSPGLVDAELFGHEAGAFTGASRQRRGLFEMAHGGTLFLDEIGELPLDLQAKLLRAVEGQPFRRVGGERELTVDVRIVSATNRDLGAMVRDGRFREDLHHRLKMFHLHLPPLRSRPDDIPALASLFLVRAARAAGAGPTDFSREAWACITAYSWPGNVRELSGVVERGAVVARHRACVEAGDLPPEVRAAAPPGKDAQPGQPHGTPPQREEDGVCPLDDVIRRHVLHVYKSTGGNLSRAARVLGISRPTLRARLVSYAALTMPVVDDGDPTALQ